MAESMVNVNAAVRAGTVHTRQSDLPEKGYGADSHVVYSPPSRRMTAEDFEKFSKSAEAKESDYKWVVITDPADAQRILKEHVQKVATTETGFTRKGVLTRQDLDMWKKQRQQVSTP